MKRDSKQRIGAACKWTELDGTQRPELNFKTSTARYLNGLEPVERHEYLMAVVQHNLRALRSQICLVGSQPPALRMWRLGSDHDLLDFICQHVLTAPEIRITDRDDCLVMHIVEQELIFPLTGTNAVRGHVLVWDNERKQFKPGKSKA